MNDPIEDVNYTISKAKDLVTLKYSGLLICGDFNLPAIKWCHEGAIEIEESNHIANSFIDNLSDSYLTQFVTQPTFQLDEYTANNILDLIIAESDDRMMSFIILR